MERITVIIPAWNEEKALKDCVKTIKKCNPEANIIVANNGSTDKTQEWLEQQQLDYIFFNEGVQTLGKVFNTVLENFDIEEDVFFLWPQIMVGKNTLQEMVNTLHSSEDIGVVGCCFNSKPYEQNIEVFSYEELLEFEKQRRNEKKRRDCSVLGNAGLCFGMKR
ncbi:MAG: glycosyltransferase, partial [Lachnospiraceae bacterium]|nr:glycosyltransferase [Lachnospiraceae bacterium]